MSGKETISALQKQLQMAGAEILEFGDGLTVSASAGPTDPAAVGHRVISTGCSRLDAWFPRGGMVPGQTIEIVSSAVATGATCLAMIMAKQVCGAGGLLVLIDRRQDFHPALLLSLGWNLENVLFVHPTSEEDHLWALEQALGDSSVAAVWTRIEKLDKRYQRRWQLAAERGQSVGILQRPEKVLGHPTWASLQVEVRANPHSDWLGGNQQVSAKAGLEETPDHWILDLTARRCPGRFEQPTLRLEVRNQVWHDLVEESNESVTAAGVGDRHLFLRERPVHANDPWFTKPVAEVSAVDVAPPVQRRR